jgi:hypothetical protein
MKRLAFVLSAALLLTACSAKPQPVQLAFEDSASTVVSAVTAEKGGIDPWSVAGPLLGVIVGSLLTAWITHRQTAAGFKAILFQQHVETMQEASEVLGGFFMLCINANPEKNPDFSRDRVADESRVLIERWQDVMANMQLYFSDELLDPAHDVRHAMIGWLYAVAKDDLILGKEQWDEFTRNRGILINAFRQKANQNKLSEEIQKKFLHST